MKLFHILLLFSLFVASVAEARPKSNAAAVSILGQSDFTSAVEFDPPTSRSLYQVEGVAIDPTSGKLFVSDNGNHRILRFSSTAAYETFAEAEAVFGQPDFTSNQPNQGELPSEFTLNGPASLCFDAAGRLWVADQSNARVLRYDDASSKPPFGAAADGVLGQPDFNSSDPATNAVTDHGFASPVGVAVDSAGNLYVSDSYAIPRILRFADAANLSGDAVSSSSLGTVIAGAFVTGSTGTAFNVPYGLCIGNDGNLWVADSANHRVLLFDNPTATGSAASLVLGQPGFRSNDFVEPPTASSMGNPFHVTTAPDGTLWVSDYSNYRVLGFVNAETKATGAAANIVLGQASFTTALAATSYTARATVNPSQIAIGREGSLFIGEFNLGAHVKRWSDPVAINAPKSVNSRGGRAKIRGTASGASSIAYQVAGQGGFRPAAGSATSWSLKAKKLKKKVTRITIKGTAFDGRVGSETVKVVNKK